MGGNRSRTVSWGGKDMVVVCCCLLLFVVVFVVVFFFSSRRRHTRLRRDWSSDVCSSDLVLQHSQRIQKICRQATLK